MGGAVRRATIGGKYGRKRVLAWSRDLQDEAPALSWATISHGGGIDKADLPKAASKWFHHNSSRVAWPAGLAVDRGALGSEWGKHLLMGALYRCLRITREVGILPVLVDVRYEPAEDFYARYEVESLSGQPLTLPLPIVAVRRLLVDV